MANPTTNYGFVLPTSSDLVTDLPADFDVALQGVDTRLKALQPGTTLGDLAYSSATANTNTRLAIGSTGNVLTVSGGVPVWAAPAGGGKLLQVVEGTTTSYATSSTTTFIDTNLTATITPTLSTSKILVIVAQAGCGHDANNGGAYFRLVRGSTSIAAVGDGIYGYSSVNVNGRRGYSLAITCLDSPATTSATTYKTQFANDGAGMSVVQDYISTAATRSSIILMEIGA